MFAAMVSIAACASSNDVTSESTAMASSETPLSIVVVVVAMVVGATVETFPVGPETTVVEVVVVGDAVETVELVGSDDDVTESGKEFGVDDDDAGSVVVVLCTIKVVKGGRLVVDVVVVGSGCVVVVLNDVVEDCVVVGESVNVVVVFGHDVTVLPSVIDEDSGGCDVDVSGSVDAAVSGMFGAVDVVVWAGETDVSRSY